MRATSIYYQSEEILNIHIFKAIYIIILHRMVQLSMKAVIQYWMGWLTEKKKCSLILKIISCY